MVNKELFKAVFVIVFAVLLFYTGIQQIKAPSPDHLTECSVDTLTDHLNAIASHPHPIGSPENIKVKEYIVSTLHLMV